MTTLRSDKGEKGSRSGFPRLNGIIKYPNLQVVVLVPFWIEGVLAGVCGMTLTRAVHADLGKWIW